MNECPDCGERYVDERRCPECNLFCRALGAGGECPWCGEAVLMADLVVVGESAVPSGARPPRSALAFGSASSEGGRSITDEDASM